MHTLHDVQKIVQHSYYGTGAQIQKVTEIAKVPEAARIAELRFSDGLAELMKLKLSREDRRHFKLLRESYLDAIKSMQAIQKGNHRKADQYGQQSGEKAFMYAKARGAMT